MAKAKAKSIAGSVLNTIIVLAIIFAILMVLNWFGLITKGKEAVKSTAFNLVTTPMNLMETDVYGLYKVTSISENEDLVNQTVLVKFEAESADYGFDAAFFVRYYKEHYTQFIEKFKQTGSGTIELKGRGQNKPRRFVAGGPKEYPVTRRLASFPVSNDKAKKGEKTLKMKKGLEVFIQDSSLVAPVKQTDALITGAKPHEKTIEFHKKEEKQKPTKQHQ